MNLFFTLLFTAELAVNAFSHWFRPFIQNGWSLLDAFIVAMSLMSLIVTNQPTGIVRILRALRVIRLFGRVKSLKKIISALSLALAPVLNVFLILFLLMGICEGPFPPLFCGTCSASPLYFLDFNLYVHLLQIILVQVFCMGCSDSSFQHHQSYT
jgi:hypothetical protein